MELRHLRYFLAVADTGSVTRAASACFVAQPSLSRQLKRLEEELGVALFRRDAGRLQLSPAGLQFVEIARDLVARADRAQATVAALKEGEAPRLTVAAPPTTIADVIAPFLATTTPDDPFITAHETVPAAAYDALARGADVAISSAPPPTQLIGEPLARLPILAYVRADHPLSRRRAVAIDELAAAGPLLLLTGEHGTRQRFDRAAVDAGVRYQVAFETGSSQIAQALAAAGHGIAVVSDDPRYGLHPLAIEGQRDRLWIDLFAAWDRDHYAVDTIRWFVSRLVRYCIHTYGSEAAPPGMRQIA
ncbi:LysR substrate-binding domain-containing protein [Conexibacter arvalis]|uniref:DNA-binding transcriptional LysR family regulator n=1 Tax=Conexibacter arvalis TaxID=912552 RepID=A0A840IB91_9ACTN|nr:DNA-binding transcriptional LysR family regulator [Conexibacter arvalis]